MLFIEKNSGKQIYLQIYEYYKNRLLSGQIGADQRLPSTRHLAGELSVSRNTVETAYQQLLAEGYLYTRPGSGYYTAFVEQLAPTSQAVSFHAQEDIAEEDQIDLPGIKYNFQYGRLAADSFPLKAWKRITNKVLLDVNPVRIPGYNSRTGEAALKEEIAKYIFESRNVACEADCVVVCAGLQTIISLLSQLFLHTTDTAAMEEPCYDAVRHIFQNHGYRIAAVPLLEDGLDMDMLAKSGARLVYITPSHQFPTGKVMSANNRIRLLQWAAEHDGYIIEDDYDSEYRYNSKPLPSLQSMDNHGRVIYCNTFSKSLAPALRLGYMVLPPALKKLYDEKFSHYSCTIPLLTQLTVAEFMSSGQWNRHLRKIALSNKKRHDHLVSQLKAVLGEHVKIQGNQAGLHFILSVYNGMDEDQLIDSAKKKGVMVYPVSQYYYVPPVKKNSVLMGFSGLSTQEMTRGVQLLREAWF